MATPKKLKSGNWRVQVFSHKDENGKNKYISITAPTKQEAQRKAAEFQCNKSYEERPQDVTVKYAIDTYIENKSNILSPKTYLEYKKYARTKYKPIENIRIGSLTDTILQKYVNSLSEKLAPKTVSNIYGLLKVSVKKYAHRTFDVSLPAKKPIERHIPTDKDIKLLLDRATPKMRFAIVLGSFGLRRGEVASLKFKDILWDFNAIYIHSDLIESEEGWFYKDIPKTAKSVRRIRLSRELLESVSDGTEDPEAYILGILPSTITSDFINLRNRLGLRCRFHDLRHYSVSIMHALGLPDSYIMDHNGYSSDRVMKDVYRHTLTDKVDNYTAITNEYYEENLLGDLFKKDDEKKAL